MEFERVAIVKAASFLDEWLAACRLAAREASRQRSGPDTEHLFDLAARTEWLPVVTPKGRVGPDFVARCRRVAKAWGEALEIEREALAASYAGEAEDGLREGELSIPGSHSSSNFVAPRSPCRIPSTDCC